MNQLGMDIWFGPGGIKGVFGAGVAGRLQDALRDGAMDPSRVRLYGSSVGCLTAAYLATGNAADGLSIFQRDTRDLIILSNLLPSLGTRLVNRLGHVARRTTPVFRVPGVLNVGHVLRVIEHRTPQFLRQLRCAPMPVFAETYHLVSSQFRHTDLRAAADPLGEIRKSLNCFPFAGSPEVDFVDSDIKGYGFAELLHDGLRSVVIVLNEPLTPRLADTISGIGCATLSADRAVASLYLNRRRNRFRAIAQARQRPRDVMLIAPQRRFKLRQFQDFESAYAAGQEAAERIIGWA